MIHGEELKWLALALGDQARFLREAGVQADIHDPKKSGTAGIASKAAAHVLEGISGALERVCEARKKPTDIILVEIVQQGTVWAAKCGERTALGVTALDAARGVIDPSNRTFPDIDIE